MNTCSTCRWWSLYDSDKEGRGWGMCLISEVDPEEGVVTPKLCEKHRVLPSYPGEDVGLETRCDFGCNQWEEKIDE